MDSLMCARGLSKYAGLVENNACNTEKKRVYLHFYGFRTPVFALNGNSNFRAIFEKSIYNKTCAMRNNNCISLHFPPPHCL